MTKVQPRDDVGATFRSVGSTAPGRGGIVLNEVKGSSHQKTAHRRGRDGFERSEKLIPHSAHREILAYLEGFARHDCAAASLRSAPPNLRLGLTHAKACYYAAASPCYESL